MNHKAQDDILKELKRVAVELGHAPSRQEYRKLSNGIYSSSSIESIFGTWSNALNACGLDNQTEKQSKKKQVNDFFYRDVKEFWNNHKENQRGVKIDLGKLTPTIIIPDLHCPWIHQPSLDQVYLLIEKLKPKRVIQIGDAYDFFSYSAFPKSQIKFTPNEEVDLARKQLEDMWERIGVIVPRAEKFQMLGNHSLRPMKRLIESGLGHLERFMDFKSIFTFDDVKTQYDTRTPIIFDGIAYTHGHLSGLGRHRYSIDFNVVHGHDHQLTLVQNLVNSELKFEMSCGYLGDPSATCFGYMPLKENNWRRGCGYISEYGPVPIPLV